jgi:hypothetical protein
MVSKIALFVASLTASLALAGALALAGFAPGTPPATAASPTVEPATSDVPAQPQVQVDKVYVAPPPKQKTITVHKVVKAARGDSEGEGGDD